MICGGKFQIILVHDGEIGLWWEEGVHKFVISPVESTLIRIGRTTLKLASHFAWPRHVLMTVVRHGTKFLFLSGGPHYPI